MCGMSRVEAQFPYWMPEDPFPEGPLTAAPASECGAPHRTGSSVPSMDALGTFCPVRRASAQVKVVDRGDGARGSPGGGRRDREEDGIVAGYDGSPGADEALRWAVREACERGTVLTVCLAWAPEYVAML